jgi:putative hydrolase of the HAD superfamily
MKAVIFDLFCTVVPGGPDAALARARHDMGIALGIDPQAFARCYRQTWPQRMRGQLGDLRSSIRAVAALADPSVTPTDEQVRAAIEIRLELLRDWIVPTTQALSTLETLRARGWRLGLLSNCGTETEEVFPHSPLATGYFDAIGLSSALGFAKPEPEAYQHVADLLGVAPHECYFVGDGAGDELPGAAAVGAHPIQVTEFAMADDPPPAWTGQVIVSLTDLPPLLGVPSVTPDAGRPASVPTSRASTDPDEDRPLATLG